MNEVIHNSDELASVPTTAVEQLEAKQPTAIENAQPLTAEVEFVQVEEDFN